jgi:hypothetical protein
MKYGNYNLFPIFVFIIGLFSITWQICGLRYTTHDDIYYNIHEKLFENNYEEFATYVAHAESRIQHYIKTPILLRMDGLSKSELYDIFNLGGILALYAGLAWVLAQIGRLQDSLIFCGITLLMFPLHYYFTIPQAFPVMGYYGLVAAFLSAGLFRIYLDRGGSGYIAGSAIAFVISLSGSEYNLVLHPILLAIVAYAAKANHRRIYRGALIFAFCWAACLLAYLIYAARHQDPTGRTIPSIDVSAFITTFITLQKKSFLPFGLIDGIGLLSNTAQGAPDVPPVLSYATLIGRQGDYTSLAIVFLFAGIVCATGLYRQRIAGRARISFFLICLAFAIIPTAVLSSSKLYQTIVPAGYIQGHISSFYSQLGFSGLLFLSAATLCSFFSENAKAILSAFFGVIFSLFITWTFIYNNLNRQIMAANQQKWTAFEELTSYISAERPDMISHSIYAPGYWVFYGTSNIPDPTPFMIDNYWTTYSNVMLGMPLTILDGKTEPPARAVFSSYFATPRNTPIVTLYERPTSKNLGTLTIVGQSRLSETISYKRLDGGESHQILRDWSCRKFCVIRLEDVGQILPDSVSVIPDDKGPRSLLAQFFLPRGGAFGSPLVGAH